MVARFFVPPLLEAVLMDYKNNVAAAREPEVLSTIAVIVNKLERDITNEIPQIFDAVFECTLEMINKNFEEYPEFRTNFFLLLQAVNNHCFPALLTIPQPQFKLVLDSIIWAFKHTMRNVANTGLNILYQLLQNISQVDGAAQQFYQLYFTDILQHVFSVVTDTSHTAGMTMHASILAYMFSLVENNKITVKLSPDEPNNLLFVQQYVANLLKTAHPVLGLWMMRLGILQWQNEKLPESLVSLKEAASIISKTHGESHVVFTDVIGLIQQVMVESQMGRNARVNTRIAKMRAGHNLPMPH